MGTVHHGGKTQWLVPEFMAFNSVVLLPLAPEGWDYMPLPLAGVTDFISLYLWYLCLCPHRVDNLLSSQLWECLESQTE